MFLQDPGTKQHKTTEQTTETTETLQDHTRLEQGQAGQDSVGGIT